MGHLVLVVEDEPLIRLAMQDALASGGFDVRTASSGDEAVGILEDPSLDVSGLVTDIRLGRGTNGWQVARLARERNPGVCVVYISGDSVAQWPAEGVPKSVILQKPVAEAQLVTAVATLFNDRSSTIPSAD